MREPTGGVCVCVCVFVVRELCECEREVCGMHNGVREGTRLRCRVVVLSISAAMDVGQRGLEMPDFPVIGSRPKDLTPGPSILPYRATPGYGETGHMTVT